MQHFTDKIIIRDFGKWPLKRWPLNRGPTVYHFSEIMNFIWKRKGDVNSPHLC